MNQKYYIPSQTRRLESSMECHHFESPISTLKVDFGYSKHSPKDVKKMLQQMKGVESISIDPSEGKVRVIGDVNPMKLVMLVQKMGIKAQLLSFERPTMQSESGSHCCCESDSEDDDDEEKEDSKPKASSDQKSNKKKHSLKDWFRFGKKHEVSNKNDSPPPPRVPGISLSPPLPPVPVISYPRMPWNPVLPNPWCNYHYGNPRALHPHRQVNSRFSTEYNPMVHYTSYADNYRFTM